mgnify:CR=1 FL=1
MSVDNLPFLACVQAQSGRLSTLALICLGCDAYLIGSASSLRIERYSSYPYCRYLCLDSSSGRRIPNSSNDLTSELAVLLPISSWAAMNAVSTMGCSSRMPNSLCPFAAVLPRFSVMVAVERLWRSTRFFKDPLEKTVAEKLYPFLVSASLPYGCELPVVLASIFLELERWIEQARMKNAIIDEHKCNEKPAQATVSV